VLPKGEQMASINEVLDRFLAAQEHAHAAEVLLLLRASLDAYAHQWLPDPDRVAWESAWPAEDQPVAFCDAFGPERIPGNVAEFLGYYMVRKVEADGALLEAAGRVIAALLHWLADEGHIDRPVADDLEHVAMTAAAALPQAAGLSAALGALARTPGPGPVLEERELLDAVVSRVEAGALWFAEPEDDEVGPVEVPADVAELAELDWGVSGLVLERTPAGWRVAEVGTVYPL
jgi:hypothetical protein